MEPRTALKPATGHYTEPVESTQSRHILTPSANLILLLFHLILCFKKIQHEVLR